MVSHQTHRGRKHYEIFNFNLWAECRYLLIVVWWPLVHVVTHTRWCSETIGQTILKLSAYQYKCRHKQSQTYQFLCECVCSADWMVQALSLVVRNALNVRQKRIDTCVAHIRLLHSHSCIFRPQTHPISSLDSHVIVPNASIESFVRVESMALNFFSATKFAIGNKKPYFVMNFHLFVFFFCLFFSIQNDQLVHL